MSKVVLDTNGREIKEGDLLRIFHYKDRSTRRNVYMYKLVVRVCGKLVCVDACQWVIYGLGGVHHCPLTALRDGRVEIIDGIHVKNAQGRMYCWYDRKKNAKPEDE